MQILVDKFKDFIQAENAMNDSRDTSNDDRLISAAQELASNPKFEPDFQETSTYSTNDEYYMLLFNILATCPSMDPNKAWSAIRTIAVGNIQTELRENNGQSEESIAEWVNTHLPIIGSSKDDRPLSEIKIDDTGTDDFSDGGDFSSDFGGADFSSGSDGDSDGNEEIEHLLNQATEEITKAISAATKDAATTHLANANSVLQQATEKNKSVTNAIIKTGNASKISKLTNDLNDATSKINEKFKEVRAAGEHAEEPTSPLDQINEKVNALIPLYNKVHDALSLEEANKERTEITKVITDIHRLKDSADSKPPSADTARIKESVDSADKIVSDINLIIDLLDELHTITTSAVDDDVLEQYKADWEANKDLLNDKVKQQFNEAYDRAIKHESSESRRPDTDPHRSGMRIRPVDIPRPVGTPRRVDPIRPADPRLAGASDIPEPADPRLAGATDIPEPTDGHSPIIEPDITHPREEFPYVYNEIDSLAISPEQADEAKSYADVVLNSPADHPREYDALTGADAYLRTRCIRSMLTTANRRLGYRTPVSRRSRDNVEFSGGVSTQSRNSAYVRNSLIMPTGFGLNRNSVLWNVPIITDFGYPFLNFSSDALMNIIQSKSIDDDIKNDQLKKMFKDAAKRYGGIWKAVYSSPLYLIRMIAQDIGIRCTPKALKIDGQALIDSEPGSTVNVTPIKYYSVDAAYDSSLAVPRDYLTTFYDVMDYSSTSKSMYLRFANGMTDEDFAEETDDNNGIPPFYILVPKKAKYSKCPIRSGSLLGSLLNVILGRKKCTMVKTIFQGKRGCLAMESKTADILFAET